MLSVESGLRPQQGHMANQPEATHGKLSEGKHFLSLVYVNSNGIVKEVEKYLLERRREKSTRFFGCTCGF